MSKRLRLTLVGLLGVSLAGWSARPRAAADREFTEQERQFWSLQKVMSVSPPAVRNRQWLRTPVDAFILDRLEAKRIGPAPRADRITLLRRAYLDLIGLPPAPDAVAAFLADRSPDAFAKVVDRESKMAFDFLQRHRAIVAARAKAGDKLAGMASLPAGVDAVDAATLVDFCHMLINSNEFVYVN
jgi:hypothetical protein